MGESNMIYRKWVQKCEESLCHWPYWNRNQSGLRQFTARLFSMFHLICCHSIRVCDEKRAREHRLHRYIMCYVWIVHIRIVFCLFFECIIIFILYTMSKISSILRESVIQRQLSFSLNNVNQIFVSDTSMKAMY